jgi:TrmH family RNA methyltransferase
MDPGRVDVVLVSPRRAGNVAAACRALKNMGLGQLVLVDGPAGLNRPEVRGLAHGAWDVLDSARTAASLAEAVEFTLVVGTSGRPAQGDWTPRRLALEAGARSAGGRVALVFGSESRGLRNEDLALCHVRVRIPAHEAQPSLNLAQAVLILAYEIFLAAQPAPPPPQTPPATAGELETLLAALRAGLLGIGYLDPLNPEAMLGELRQLLARAGPTARELALLRGVASQVQWAARATARAREGNG